MTAMTHVLQKGDVEQALSRNEDSQSLGPTLTAEVCVEGRPSQALLDTGSPVSIVSINFLLQALMDINKDVKSRTTKRH